MKLKYCVAYIIWTQKILHDEKALPYFVCAKFDPAVRRLENFASTSCFVVDIDKIDEDEVTLEGLKMNWTRMTE